MKINNEDKLIKDAVSIIKKYLPEAKVYLFGSRACNSFNEKSDIDIAINNKDLIPFDVLYKINEEIENLPTLLSFDIVDLSKVDKDFKQQVLKEGILIE